MCPGWRDQGRRHFGKLRTRQDGVMAFKKPLKINPKGVNAIYHEIYIWSGAIYFNEGEFITATFNFKKALGIN
jgi:hypothetical protein